MEPPLTTEQRQQILAAYQQVPSTSLVAAQLQISGQRVRSFLRRNGIRLSRSTGGACYHNIDLVREMAADGASLADIARRIGTKHQLVGKFLREHEIPHTRFRQVGANNPAWKGGRMRDKDGYVLIHHPEHPHANRHGYVREHRLVMEHVLGRHLLPTEVVDHIDGVKDHNSEDNLRLFASNREHLAATLTGRTPKWTEQGLDRLRESFDRGLGQRNRTSQVASGAGDHPSRRRTSPTEA